MHSYRDLESSSDEMTRGFDEASDTFSRRVPLPNQRAAPAIASQELNVSAPQAPLVYRTTAVSTSQQWSPLYNHPASTPDRNIAPTAPSPLVFEPNTVSQKAEVSMVPHSVEERSRPEEHEEARISGPEEVRAVPYVVERSMTPGHEEVRILLEPVVSAVPYIVEERSIVREYEEARTLSEPVEVSTVPQPAGETTISQLFKEFNAHLVAELSDGACRGRLEECIRQVCSTNQSVVREALQAVASTFASYICDHFAEEMTQKATAAQKAPWRAQLPSRSLQAADEYAGFLSEFVQQNLRRFYDPYDETVRDIARQAARNASRKVNVPHELMPGLAKLALYDFIIFCGM